MLDFNSMYGRTYNFVYLRAKSMFKKEDDIVQLMKEVYSQAVAYADEIEEENLYEWLGKQTYVLGVGKYRRKKAREAELIELGQAEYEIQKGVNQEATKEIICNSLADLPDLYQATLYAFYYDQMKIKEIVAIMGYDAGVIINRLNYAHKYLSKALENYKEDEKENVQFSVEAVLDALREWSVINRLPVENAQNVYASVCRQLGVPAELELRKNELAGANNQIAKRDGEALAVICEELETYSNKPIIGKREIVFIAAGILALALIVVAAVNLLGGDKKEKDPGTTPPVVEQESEKQQEVEGAVDADTNTEAEADAEATDQQEEKSDEAEKNTDTAANSEYILPNSNTQKLTRADLSGLTKEELRLARNEIFARHGMVFGITDLDNYFGSKSWYEPTVASEDFNDTVEMSLVEEQNVSLILAVEAEME